MHHGRHGQVRSSAFRLRCAVRKSAREAGDTDLALAIFRYFIPVGNCSMDQGPRETAHQYSALCYQLGRLGSYLQLRVAILGDQFERIASSSYGERASRTGAEEFESTGLDVDSFLLGLLVDLDAPRRQGIDAWRLGRGIVEASRSKTLEPTLRRWAQDHRIDAWNRTRAAIALGSLYYQEALETLPNPAWDAVREKFLEVKPKVLALDITPAARAWLERE